MRKSDFLKAREKATALPSNLLISLRPRPQTVHVSQGATVFETDANGIIPPNTGYGLYVDETRLLSKYCYAINRVQPQPIALSNIQQHSWLGYYVTVPPGQENAFRDLGSGQMDEVSEYTLEMRISRYVGSGMHEDIDLTNFSRRATSFTFDIDLDADFIDREELHAGREQHGDLRREWRKLPGGGWELDFDYQAEHHYDHQGNVGVARIHRGLRLQILNPTTDAEYSKHRISFQVHLPPRAQWHTCMEFIARIEDSVRAPEYRCNSFSQTKTRFDRQRVMFLSESTKFRSPADGTLTQVVLGALRRAKEDMIGLRLHDFDRGDRAWVMAAGLPIYVSLFGRDTLTTAWQSSILGPEMMKGVLPELADWQGTEENPWRDEQPGKMLHEAHTGPLAKLRFNPRDRYYGAITTSAFYPVVLSEFWHWTGDKDLVYPLLSPAMKALQWLQNYGDLNGDGFDEYLSRSTQGNKHQGWKDSGDAIVYHDGTQVEPPIATCEEQGFEHAAKLQFSELLWRFGKKDEARKLFHQAQEMKKRFNEAFWMPDLNFVALGLDSQKQQIKSITSNPGHCIATGILDSSLVKRTADRMFQPDMFSGWGIRTLSSENPAYNPYSYHRGSIWPVEHGTFALGFMRYGLLDHLQKMSRALFEAVMLFDYFRLPELFGGHQRDDAHPFPAIYPKANWPQAWSSSALFTVLQALLGIYPYAPSNLLFIDPQLPDWLPEITLEHLRVGKASVTIRFYREPSGRSNYEILDQRGKLRVIRQPSPWSQTAHLSERFKDFIESFTHAA